MPAQAGCAYASPNARGGPAVTMAVAAVAGQIVLMERPARAGLVPVPVARSMTIIIAALAGPSVLMEKPVKAGHAPVRVAFLMMSMTAERAAMSARPNRYAISAPAIAMRA